MNFTANDKVYKTYEEMSKLFSLSADDKSNILRLNMGASYQFVDANGAVVTVTKAANLS